MDLAAREVPAMAIRFDPSSANITIDSAPGVRDPQIAFQPLQPVRLDSVISDLMNDLGRLIEGNKVWFVSERIRATGTVRLDGAPGDNASNWELGFLQVRYVRTTWLHYKADWTDPAALKHGSMLLQVARPPAMPRQQCRDVWGRGPANQIWYSPPRNGKGTAGAFPQTLTATFLDQPWSTFPTVISNSLTNQPNFLREGQLELLFCTALALREPGGRFHLLKHFFWNVLWQATFQPTDFKLATHVAWLPPNVRRTDTSANISKIFDGDPDREPFRNVLTSTAEVETCNDLFRRALPSVLNPPFPGRQEETDRDHEFDVRR
jgi:hypothetical protein